ASRQDWPGQWEPRCYLSSLGSAISTSSIEDLINLRACSLRNDSICNLIREAITVENGVCDSRSLVVRTLDIPVATFANQLHLGPSPPPLIDFAWQSRPDLFARNHLPQVIKKRLIDSSRRTLHQIVGVGDKTHQ